jgi:hypothetical protein
MGMGQIELPDGIAIQATGFGCRILAKKLSFDLAGHN